MDKRKVFTLIFLCFLVTSSLCKEEPNHLSAESSSEVTGFKNPSARHAGVQLRSPQHKLPVQISKTRDSFSSDVERIGSLDGGVLPASKNAKKSIKWTTNDKIRNVATMRRLKFAMRRSGRQHKVLKSPHSTGMPLTASFLKDSKDKKAFTFQTAPPSSITGLRYKTKITTPFKLTILPTKKTAIPSVDTADVESEWPSKEGNTTEQDNQKSSHSDGKEESSSVLKDSKDKKVLTFQTAPPSSITGLPYKTKITTPLKLTILPTKETAIPSVDTADVESEWPSKEGNTTEQDNQKSAHSDGKEESSSPHGEPKVTEHEGSARHAGTSAMPQLKMAVPPGVKPSSGLRWKAAYDHIKLDDSKKGKHFKDTKKKFHSEDEEPTDSDSSSPAATFEVILVGILMLLLIFTAVPRLWRICKKRWRRRFNGKLRLNFPSSGYFSEELSEEEIIFDRTTTRRNKGASPVATPMTPPRGSQSEVFSFQSPAYPTQEEKIWTVTSKPRSTPLMAVPTLDDSPRTNVWMVNETPGTKPLDSLFSTSSLSDLSTETPRSASLTSVSSISLASEAGDSDLAIEAHSLVPAFDLTDNTVHIPLPITIQPRLAPCTSSEQTTLESSLSSQPSKPSLSLLPTASNESTQGGSMASDGTSSSKESCKTPVAACNEVVITLDDDDEEIRNSRDKSESEVLAIETQSSVTAFDLTDNTVHIPPPFTTQPRLGSSTSSEQTTLASSLSSQPSKSSLSSLPAASNKSTPGVSMASDGTSSSKESCKTPVAARNEVVRSMDDDDEAIRNSRDKSESEVLAIETRSSVTAFDLTDNTVHIPPPFKTQPSTSSEQTTLESSLSSQPSKPSLSLLPTASNESTPGVFMASDGTSSSTESCETPVAATNEVVITMDDDVEEINNSRDKSESEVLDVETHSSAPAFDLTDNTVHIPPPFTTQPSTSSEQTTLESSLSSQPSKPSLSLLPTASNESTPGVFMASDGTSSSTESCKTPVAARNEVVITMDDDDDEIRNSGDKSESEAPSVVKDADKESSMEEVVIRVGHGVDEESSVISESESDSSFGEMVCASQESEMKTDVTTSDAIIDIMESDNNDEEMSVITEKSNQDETPQLTLPTIPPPTASTELPQEETPQLTLPTIPPPTASTELLQDETPLLTLPTIPPQTASTELPQGKALIGGRKALENRRFIKHLISEQYSTGFKSDLNAASSRILGEKKNLVDKNKVKRLVIKQQTLTTKHSLIDSILRAKSMIMNENVDTERDKRSYLCRRLIQRRLKYPGQPKQTLDQEISFAKDIILLRSAHPRDAAGPEAKREVRREDESMTSLDKGASTSNSAKIRVLNHKDYKAWKERQKDIKMKKEQGIKPRDALQSLQVVRDIYNLPRIPVDSEGGCLCYYCEKHLKRAQRKKFFKLPKKLFSFKSKSSSTKESSSDSQSSSFTSSAAAGPSTSSAAHFDSGMSNDRVAH